MSAWLQSVRERWKDVVEEYGRIALFTWLAISAVVFTTFLVLINLGYDINSSTATAGIVGAAWIGLKLTQPFRMLATVALTPGIAVIVRRYRRSHPTEPVPPVAAPPDDAA